MLEFTLRNKVPARSVRRICPTPPFSATEHPEMAIERTISQIKQIIEEIESNSEESRIVLVGRSYGAFIALMAACRLKFEKIFKAILIEGPLNPEVTVNPPALIPPLLLCAKHYENRPTLAQEALETLNELGTAKVVIVCGREDSVVPPAAQQLPRDFQILELQNDDLNELENFDSERGVIIVLPAHIGGVSAGPKKILPKGYRNHLFWSDQKFDMIRQIIIHTTSDATISSETSRRVGQMG